MKVDREAVATLVLPQLWAMSVGPCERLILIPQASPLIQIPSSVEYYAVPAIHDVRLYYQC